MPLRHRFPFLAAAALVAGSVVPANRAGADTLSWSSLNPQYNPTPAQAIQATNLATINGNTVSIQFGNNSFFSNGTLNANSPASPATGTYGSGANAYYTDGGAGKTALQIIADFDDSAGKIIAGAAIPVTVFFTQPVSNLMFSFYDVDNGTFGGATYNDKITNISARLGTSGPVIAPTSLGGPATGATFSGSIDSGTNTGSFTASANNAQNAGNGNATVTFGQPITQFTFTYTDTAAAVTPAAHSTLQIIALSDLTFTTVPEPSTWALAGMGVATMAWLLRRRRGGAAA